MIATLGGLTVLLLTSAAFTAQSQADDVYYCNQYVAGYSACPQHANGYFNQNHGYIPGSSFGAVCEKATITYQAGDVSRRCANGGFVDSACDLYFYYNNHYELSVYVGNNQGLVEYLSGHGYVESEGTCA